MSRRDSSLKYTLVDRIRVMIFPLIFGDTGRERIFDGLPDLDLQLVSSRHPGRSPPVARVRTNCSSTHQRFVAKAQRGCIRKEVCHGTRGLRHVHLARQVRHRPERQPG